MCKPENSSFHFFRILQEIFYVIFVIRTSYVALYFDCSLSLRILFQRFLFSYSSGVNFRRVKLKMLNDTNHFICKLFVW